MQLRFISSNIVMFTVIKYSALTGHRQVFDIDAGLTVMIQVIVDSVVRRIS